MTIADGIHQIVDNINGAKTARVTGIAELTSEVGAMRADAQKDLKQINRTRRHDATAQKKTLHTYAKTLKNDSQDMLGGFSANRIAMGQESQEELGDFTRQLKKDVTDIRVDAVNMVQGFADERVSSGIELSRMLKSYNDGIVDDVEYLMGTFKKERNLVRKDLAEAHAIWQSQGSGGHTRVKAPKRTVAKAAEPVQTPEKKADAALKQKILKVIKAAPDGITLAKAGKKIGVEWRKLIKPAKELLEAGMVTKKETQYFLS